MSTLIVVGYDDPNKAEEVHLKFRKMQRDYLIDYKKAGSVRGALFEYFDGGGALGVAGRLFVRVSAARRKYQEQKCMKPARVGSFRVMHERLASTSARGAGDHSSE